MSPAVSGPIHPRHPSPFRKAQKISRPSAATTAHIPSSVSALLELYPDIFSRLIKSRVQVGATRIMDRSLQPSFVLVSSPTYSHVQTCPLPPHRLLLPKPRGWTILLLMPFTARGCTHP